MGVVYRAREDRPARRVALKVISPDLAGDAGFRERFERETELAADIEHSNVLPVYRVGEEAGLLYLITRYVEGTDLAALLAAQGRLEPRRAVGIVAQVCEALDAAHARGLVHRDVKPANVLIATEGGRDHAYLADFGLTKRLDATSGLTRTGTFFGTLDYAAPEQFEGGRVDARTDVYATGCVLYHALTGHVPFPAESAAAGMFAHMSQPPPSLADTDPTIPAALDGVITKAMAKAPDDRYLSAGDLGRAALAAVEGNVLTRAEHSVAVGEAAEGEPMVVDAPSDAPAAVEPPPAAPTVDAPVRSAEPAGTPPTIDAPGLAAAPAALTESRPPAGPKPSTPADAEPVRPRSRRLRLLTGLAAVVVTAAVLVLVLGGSKDDGRKDPLYRDLLASPIVRTDVPAGYSLQGTLDSDLDKRIPGFVRSVHVFFISPHQAQPTNQNSWAYFNVYKNAAAATAAYKDRVPRTATTPAGYSDPAACLTEATKTEDSECFAAVGRVVVQVIVTTATVEGIPGPAAAALFKPLVTRARVLQGKNP